MSLPVRKSSITRPLHPYLGMQTKYPQDGLRVDPSVNQCYKFPYFIKGVPPHWKNPPPSVKFFSPFGDLKFRLKLRMLDRQRRKFFKK